MYIFLQFILEINRVSKSRGKLKLVVQFKKKKARKKSNKDKNFLGFLNNFIACLDLLSV